MIRGPSAAQCECDTPVPVVRWLVVRNTFFRALKSEISMNMRRPLHSFDGGSHSRSVFCILMVVKAIDGNPYSLAVARAHSITSFAKSGYEVVAGLTLADLVASSSFVTETTPKIVCHMTVEPTGHIFADVVRSCGGHALIIKADTSRNHSVSRGSKPVFVSHNSRAAASKLTFSLARKTSCCGLPCLWEDPGCGNSVLSTKALVVGC